MSHHFLHLFDEDCKSFEPIVVAEIGINHNGDISLAKESIAAAAEMGAKSVKFQNYSTEEFAKDKSVLFHYISQGKKISEPQYDMFKRCELTFEQLHELKIECDKYNVIFHSTPTGIGGINDLVKLGSKVLKNGSDFLTNYKIIEQMGMTQIPTVLSTGMASLAEIDDAVQVYKRTGNNKLMLLHCTSSYPAPINDVNLSRIHTLNQAFGLPIGFSDHTEGNIAAVCSVMYGARWIEKHFTLDKNLPGPDHWFSMDPKQLQSLVQDIRDASMVHGDNSFAFTQSEATSRLEYRLSCTASSDLAVGHYIESTDISYQRPGSGLPPSTSEYLVGLELKKPIKSGQQFTFDFFK